MKIYQKEKRILEEWVGKRIYIYNGKGFQRKLIHRGMVGYKVGEFILTKKLGGNIHLKEGKKKKKGK